MEGRIVVRPIKEVKKGMVVVYQNDAIHTHVVKDIKGINVLLSDDFWIPDGCLMQMWLETKDANSYTEHYPIPRFEDVEYLGNNKMVGDWVAGEFRNSVDPLLRELKLISGMYFILSKPVQETFNRDEVKGFAEWLNQNRWYTFEPESKKWCYTFEHGTAMPKRTYEKNYMKTTEELLKRYKNEV